MMAARRRVALLRIDDPYVQQALQEAFARYASHWKVIVRGDNDTDNNADLTGVDLQWDEYERIDWDRVDARKMVANWYTERKGMIRKAQLTYNINRLTSKRGSDSTLAKHYPQTFFFELYHPDEVDELLICELPEIKQLDELPEHERQVWILKPSITNQAADVHVFDSTAAFRSILERPEVEDIRQWVVQRYIDRPLLIDGRKFHVRVYVVAIGTLQVYVFHRALALFSLHPYSPTELQNLYAHITNTCYQKQGSTDDEPFDEERAVWLFDEMCEHAAALLVAEGRSPDELAAMLWRQIDAIVRETFEACIREAGYTPLCNAFEFYGFDFIIDEELHVWLLEVNAGPDMGQTGERLRNAVVQPLVNGAVSLVLEHLFPDDDIEPTHDDDAANSSLFECVLSDGSAHSR